MPLTDSEADYRKLMRRAYKLIQGTWGYCNLEYEELTLTSNDLKQAAVVQPVVINNLLVGGPPFPVFLAGFQQSWAHVARGYACFKDEDDALQFRLMIGAKAIRIHMWPAKRLFTIHELVEDES